jgi:thiamine-phosphate pyrophosphorylase
MNRTGAILASRLKLHVLTDRASSQGRDILTVARAALAGGATVIQLRDKTASTAQLLAEGYALRALTRAYGALLIINDRVDIALAVEADGAHIGQDDLPAPLARQLLGSERILGISAGNCAEAAGALAAGADYLGVGPIFGTRSKADAGLPIGTEFLAELAARSTLPLVAIGGITAENAALAIQAGASGIAVITAVTTATDIEAATRLLALAIEAGRSESTLLQSERS